MKHDIMSCCGDDILEAADRNWENAGKKPKVSRPALLAAALLAVCVLAAFAVAAMMKNGSGVPVPQTDDSEGTSFGNYASPPAYRKWICLSYKDFYQLLFDPSPEEDPLIESDYDDLGPCFRNLFRILRDGTAPLLVPAYRGQIMPLKVSNGYAVILFSEEKFNLPWVWYNCEVSGAELVVELCNLRVIEDKTFPPSQTYADISRYLASLYPTAGHLTKEHLEVYSTVFEETIRLGDETVEATVLKNKSEEVGRETYLFRYGEDWLVSVWNRNKGEYTLFTDEFWADFSLIPYRNMD